MVQSNEPTTRLVLDALSGQEVTTAMAYLHMPPSRRNGLRLLRKCFHMSTI